MAELASGTVTFLFTDIEASTALLKRLGRERYGELLAEHQDILRGQFDAHHGEVIDTQGDSFFVAFRSASDAVSTAIAIQRAVAGHDWPDRADPRVRIGIHSGEAAAARERYVGFSVHRAARIGAAAHGGQVLLSSATRELVEDDLQAGVSLRDLGLHRLKDVDRPERITQVAAEGLPGAFPPLRGAERVKPQPALRRLRLIVGALVPVVAAAIAVPLFVLNSSGTGGPAVRADAGGNQVRVVDPSNGGLVGSLALGSAPDAIVSGLGSVWTANTSANSVSRVAPETRTVEQTIAVGDGPSGITVGGGFVWVANSLDGTLSQIDPQSNGGQVVQTIPVGNGPAAVAYGLGAVWVANSGDRTVVRVDPASGKPGTPIPVDAGADSIAVGEGAVWIASESAGSVSRIDPKTHSVTATVNVGSGPSAVTVSRGAVWVTNKADGTVSLIDAVSNRQKLLIPVGNGPSGIAASTDGSDVWVSNEASGTLSRIDAGQHRVVETVVTGDRPQDVTVTANAVYVAVRTGGSAHRGGMLTLLGSSVASFAPNIDPNDSILWSILVLGYDGLLGFKHVGGSEGTTLVPDLAVAIPTPTDGGKAYTFRLRRGVRYSNGTLVGPSDIRRAIERALAGSDQYLRSIVGAQACTRKHCDLSQGVVTDPETNTVTFRLTRPDPDFLYKLALPIAFAVPPTTPLSPQKTPLPATGPYMVARYDASHEIRLVRNPYFHEWSSAAQPNGYPDVILWKLTRSASKTSGAAQVRAVERDQADVAWDGVPTELLSEVKTRYARLTHLNASLSTFYIPLNTRVPPFSNLNARRALSYAIDRRLLLPSQGGTPSCQILPPGLFGYRRYCPYTVDPTSGGTYVGPDLTKARRLVSASGTRGQSVMLWIAAGPLARHRAAYLTTVLRSLGYRPRVHAVKDLAALFGALTDPRKQVQMAVGIGFTADYVSPADFFQLNLMCGAISPKDNQNFAEFCDPRIDAEIKQAQLEQQTDPHAAAALWNAIDREVVDQAPWVVTANYTNLDFIAPRVGNYVYNPQWGALYDQMWVR